MLRTYDKLEHIETMGAKTLHGPVSASPGATGSGSGPGRGSPSTRITYGEPSQNTFRVLKRGSRSVVLELVTDGFYAEPLEDGSVRLVVPGLRRSERRDAGETLVGRRGVRAQSEDRFGAGAACGCVR